MAAGRWVELPEKEAIWYHQVGARADAIMLMQTGGSPTTVRLFADRLVKDNPELTGMTVFFR